MLQTQKPPAHCEVASTHAAQLAPQCSGSSSAQATQAPSSHQLPAPHCKSAVQRQAPSVQTGVPVCVQSTQLSPQRVSESQASQAPLAHHWPVGQDLSLQKHAPATQSGVVSAQGRHAAPQRSPVLQGSQAPSSHS